MDIARSLTFGFKDPEWTNRVAMGTAIMLIPIFNFATTGYQVEIARRVMRGESRPLPTWDNPSRKWTNGIVLFLVMLVYYLPVSLLICGPLAILAPGLLLLDEQKLKATIGTALLIWSLFFCTGLLFYLVIDFFTPAIYLQYVRHGTLAACLNFSAILSVVRRHKGEYLSAWLGAQYARWIYAGVVMASSLIGLVPFVGTLVQLLLIGAGAFWTEMVIGHLVGELGILVESSQV
jgi:hypothetical protein